MVVRTNFLTDETVYISEDRANRPVETAGPAVDRRVDRNLQYDQCPFCPGNEHLAAENVYRAPNGRVRIIRNKYPFIEPPDGNHYVLIDTPEHRQKIYGFAVGHIAEIFSAARHRFNAEYEGGAEYLQLFKNEGARAGASLHHSHWQITAQRALPPRKKTVLENFRLHRARTGSCYICDEILKHEYVICENPYFTAFCPHAPRFPNEINVAPKRHVQSLTQLTDDCLHHLADILKKCLSALNDAIPYFNFNIYLHEAPPTSETSHFYIVVAPRVGGIAGFELATGIYVHSILPETSVKIIKMQIFSAFT
jgi:UDPglucose--hexose-1-phosphate uridylyltransferase